MSTTADQIANGTGKQTTIKALKPVAASEIDKLPAITVGFGSLQSFELMQRAAKLLSSSTLVPKDYQGQLPNCVVALNMAQRMGADPLMVMQSLYLVHGRPSWSAQFLIASFNQCGRFSAIRYKWSGAQGKDDWTCQAYAKELNTGEVISGPEISIALAKKEGWYQKSGSKWQSIPQLMLMYRAAAWLVRTHAPEISMGLQTAEEIHDVYDARRGIDGHFEVTTDSLRAAHAVTDSVDSPQPTDTDWLSEIINVPGEQQLHAIWNDYIGSLNGEQPDEACVAAYEARKEQLAKAAE